MIRLMAVALVLCAGGCASIGQWDRGEEVVGVNERFQVSMVAKDYQDFLSGMNGTRLFARNNGPAAVCVSVNNGAWTHVPAGQERVVSEKWRSGGGYTVGAASNCA
jgi:hypothetical protein